MTKLGKIIGTGLAAAVAITAGPFATAASAAQMDDCVLNVQSGKTTCYTSLASALAATRGSAQQVIGGILFEDRYRAGRSLAIEIGNPCVTSQTIDYQVNIPLWFNDLTSSYEGYSNCLVQVHENTNYGGRYDGPRGYQPNLSGILNDAASSVRLW
ncbi:hypothetical protein [Mangrovihabitans endophyticus]|uniref:Uncharacterized protein n=1 Tax=Mangrovihabitans endophyticus TaxID=1751298 RepID=A0A8J3C617_9ACTN|nr:hypothetical protein [Mangrovihabitans endophyticus]GGL13139.1 hypothetical protein GCM10012284_54750 [Mangrovihabitans endophyticus]